MFIHEIYRLPFLHHHHRLNLSAPRHRAVNPQSSTLNPQPSALSPLVQGRRQPKQKPQQGRVQALLFGHLQRIPHNGIDLQPPAGQRVRLHAGLDTRQSTHLGASKLILGALRRDARVADRARDGRDLEHDGAHELRGDGRRGQELGVAGARQCADRVPRRVDQELGPALFLDVGVQCRGRVDGWRLDERREGLGGRLVRSRCRAREGADVQVLDFGVRDDARRGLRCRQVDYA